MITVLERRLVDEQKHTLWRRAVAKHRIFGIMINSILNFLNSVIPFNNELGNSVKLSCAVVFENNLPT